MLSQSLSTAQPEQLIGVGLRHPHLDYFAQESTSIGWMEVHSENYFRPQSVARQQLRRIAKHTPISCHGVGLSLGSVERVNRQHLQQLKNLIYEFNPILVSDHLSWSQNGGHYFNDLLPLPYTEEALEVFCRNVLDVQDVLGQPILIENPSSYLAFNHSTIDEWEFLSQVHLRTECRLLLDLNNIHVSAFNHDFDSRHYIRNIPHHAVDEIHLAGFTVKKLEQGEVWIDTHSQPVSKEVWDLYQFWLSEYGVRPTLIEWDLELPEPEILLAEADKARQIITQTLRQTYQQAHGG